jgi:hypothetical protein
VSVSGEGTTAVISARKDEDPNGEEAGSAYVFSQNDGQWSQQQKLAADDGDSDDGFGQSVAVSSDGTTALIRGQRDDTPNGDRAGSVYVFTREDAAPGGGAGPSVRATVQQPGTAGGQARVQYIVSNVSGQASVGLVFTTPAQLSVNASASETTGTFGSNAQRVLFFQPDSEVTATVAFEIPATASADDTFDIEATVLNENSTATDTVTTTVGDVETGPVARFDADDDGEISFSEVQAAIRAFSNGELDLQGVQQVIAAFSG